MSFLQGRFDAFAFAFLWCTAAACFVVGAWLHGRYFDAGFTRAQEGAERKEGRRRSRILDGIFEGRRPSTRELVSKEIRVFFRDTTQWSQLILLGVLVAVYVYNITVLPLYTGEQVSFLLINVVSFLNLGLAGFVVAAIAARFVFPAISIEGRMMWLLRSSPVDVRTVFWSKYWVGTIPLLAVALPLIVGTNIVLDASPFILTLTSVTMVGITFALTSLALGFGALYPNYDTENVAEIPTSFGGLLFMMAAVTYLAGVVILEAWPVYLFLSSRVQGGEAQVGVAPLLIGVASATILTAFATVLPLRAGVRKVQSIDF
jgi:ABC-2 type transport system permease protein